MDSGLLIRIARKRAGLSLRELAARANTSHSTLSDYERGVKTPAIDTLTRIVESIGFTVTFNLVPYREPPGIDRDTRARGEQLAEVLYLADQFPAKHTPTLRFPLLRAAIEKRANQLRGLVEKIVALHNMLDGHRIPHAFGGALALAWCTNQPRGTADIDVNVFVSTEQTDHVLRALAPTITSSETERESLRRDGQVRLWWDTTPVDVFLNNTVFHEDVALRTHHHEFAGQRLPFLSCEDLAVFKAFFNRPKDWVDLQTMHDAGSLRPHMLAGTLAELLGADDARVSRVRELGEILPQG